MTPVRYSADERVIEPSSSMLTEVVSYLGSWSNEAMLRVFETLVKNIENDRRSEPQLEEEFPPRIFYADPESEEIDVVGFSSQDESHQEDVVDACSTTVTAPHYSDISDDDSWTTTERRRYRRRRRKPDSPPPEPSAPIEDVYEECDQYTNHRYPPSPPPQNPPTGGRKKKRDRGTRVVLEPLRASFRMTSDGRWTLIRKNDNPVTDLEEYYEYEAKKNVPRPFSKPLRKYGKRFDHPNCLYLEDAEAFRAEQQREELLKRVEPPVDRNGIEMHRIYDRVVAEVAHNAYSEYEDGRRVWYAADGRRLNSRGHPTYTKEEMEMPFDQRPDLTRDSFGRSYLED